MLHHVQSLYYHNQVTLLIQSDAQFLAFVTASAALPRGEESDRYYDITIQHKHGGDDEFPMAHTCFNRLDLPDYKSKAIMRTRILFCLEHLQDAGFGEA